MKKLLFVLFLFSTGCLKQYPVTPQVADSATYKLMANDSYQGTAWAVNDHTLISAGHMCDASEDNYIATSTSGRVFRAHSVAWEQSSDGLADICALHVDAPMPVSLVIADEMPKPGDQVWYNGFPDGVYVMKTGQYLGDMDGKKAHLNDFAASAPSDHGASGSAMFTRRGVWGILVRIRTDLNGGLISLWDDNPHDGSDGEACIDLATIRKFLDETGVSYDSTPAFDND